MRSATNPGMTLLELLVVLAILLILAAFTLPSFEGLYGNSKQKAAADIVKARIAMARARAIETGTPQRLAVSADGLKIRLAPDTEQFGQATADTRGGIGASANEDTLDKVTAAVAVPDDEPQPSSDGTWTTVATFKPDGTCKEHNVTLELRQDNFPPIRIQIRGVTGTARVLSNTQPPSVPGGTP